MNKALICVDVQVDFLPGGALGVPDGHQTIRPLIRLMDKVDIIVLTRDWHPRDHVSFSDEPQFVDGSWPPHCVEWTKGAQFDNDLLDAAQDTGKPVLLVNKGMNRDKEAYSGFEGTVIGVANDDNKNYQLRDAELAAALRAISVDEILIGGLALDYCVKATALDSEKTRFYTTVYMDATRPVSYLTGAEAIHAMTRIGIRINTTELF